MDPHNKTDLTEALKAAAAVHGKAVSDAAGVHAKAVGEAAGAQARLMASDLWAALKTDWRMQVMVALLFVSLLGWNAPIVGDILYPFKLFTTIIHEACHALAARITGGNVSMIEISTTEAGVTHLTGGWLPLIGCAGYLGASTFGALLIWWGRKPEIARTVLKYLGIVILSLTVFYGGGTIFSFIMMLAIGAALLAVAYKCSQRVCHGLLLMLAVQTTLQASFQLQYLMYQMTSTNNGIGGMSDALLMEKATGIPALVWTLLWAAISIAVFVYAFWIAYRPGKTQAVISEPVPAPAAALVEPTVESAVPSASEPGETISVTEPESVEAQSNLN